MAAPKLARRYERCKGLLCEGCGEKQAAAKGFCVNCYAKSRDRLSWQDAPPTIVRQRHRLPFTECLVCGAQYRPKRGDRTTCCSRECGLRWSAYKTLLRANGGRVTLTVVRGKCVHCGGWFTKKRDSAAHCSDGCRSAAAEAKEKAAYVPRSFDCGECGRHVETEYGNKASRFCSKKCAGRNERRRRRCRDRALRRLLKAGTVDPVKVFERDGWRCQLCGAKTLKSKRGTYHDRAPELDHIVPLALNGEHSYRNTQCACRKCNAAKSNGPGGQLLLFGMVA